MAPTRATTLVLDTAPLLKNLQELYHVAESLVTIPEVLMEVRDKRARENLAALPYDIKIMQPSEEALKAVSLFARKTGDYGILSTTDLKVLALTYTLEKEATGGDHIRLEPLKPLEITGGNFKHNNYDKPSEMDKSSEEIIIGSLAIVSETQNAHNLDSIDSENINALSLSPLVLKGESDIADDSSDQSDHSPSNNSNITEIKSERTSLLPGFVSVASDDEGENSNDDDSDNDGGWITVANIEKAKRSTNSQLTPCNDDSSTPDRPLTVACMTSDFAMQNVLLQMNLNLLSLDGMVIKQVKSWLLRCHACFKTTHNMEKQFCPSCGNATLLRTSYCVDSEGHVRYFLRKNFQYKIRGSQYSLPDHKTGRNTNNLIIREDQKEYLVANKNYHYHRNKLARGATIFDPDYTPRMMLGNGKAAASASESAMWAAAPPTIGYGRRNPNASKKRIDKKKKRAAH